MLLDVGVLLGWLSIAAGDDANSPFFLLNVAFLLVDVVLEALVDDIFVVSSLVRDDDVDLETFDVRFHSDFARCFACDDAHCAL